MMEYQRRHCTPEPLLSTKFTDLNIAEAIRLACVLEVTARKPGNVHPEASFADLKYEHFVTSAAVAAPALAAAGDTGVGRAIHMAAVRTHAATGRNTNLGTLLLIAPLAAVPAQQSLREGIDRVLCGLGIEDARFTYDAIRLMQPGGMGLVESEDISGVPTCTLLECMQLAADRDLVALQYANGYQPVIYDALDLLAQCVQTSQAWDQTVITLQLSLMSHYPDTLIERKCGPETARESADRAKRILDAGWPDAVRSRSLLKEFDSWLRNDGHRRNPGTTADLIAACLFAALREGVLDHAKVLQVVDPETVERV